MDIAFSCPDCRGTLVVDEKGAGRAVPCPMCRAAVTIPPPTPSLYLRAGVAAEECGDYAAALKCFTDVAHAKPTMAQAWLGIARAQAWLIDHSHKTVESEWKSILELVKTAMPLEPRRSSVHATSKAIRRVVMAQFVASLEALAKGMAESQSAGFGKDKPVAEFVADLMPVLQLLSNLRLMHAADLDTCDTESVMVCVLRALMPYEPNACAAMAKVLESINESRKALLEEAHPPAPSAPQASD